MQFLRALDTATLAFVTGLAGLLLAFAMLGIRLAGMRHRALVFWAAAGLAVGVAHLLAHVTLTSGTPLPAQIALGIANALVTLVHALLLAGVLEYLGRKSRWVPLVAFSLLMGLAGIVWPDGWHLMRNRILVLATVYLAMDLTAGVLLWRAGRSHRERFQNLAGLSFLLNSCLLAVRIGHALFAATPAASFDGPFQTLVFVLGLVFVSSLTIGLALLMFRAKELELQQLVHRDPMTGLFNRRSLFEHAAREQARAERYSDSLSFVMLDIDEFKVVNDTFGHAAGDEVICQAATRIGCALRDVDSAFRLGGEEFLILLPSTDLDAAIAVAERLRSAIAHAPMDVIGRRITASFGVTELVRGDEDWESAMRRADVALYRAKDEGRNRVFGMSTTRTAHAAQLPDISADAPLGVA